MPRQERRSNPRIGLDDAVRDRVQAEQAGMELAVDLRDKIAQERESVRRLRMVVDRTR